MKFKEIENKKLRRKYEFVLKASELEKEVNEKLEQERPNVQMKGFRKGKVPESIVKKNIGPSVEAHFAEDSINTYYRKALEELKLIPINQASIDKLEFKEGSPLSFSARFEVHPVVSLPNYSKKFKIKATRYIADKDDVEQALTNYQEQNAKVKTIDDGAKSGHFIRGDFHMLDESGNPITQSKMENQYIRLGFGLFKDESEKELLGAKAGDELKVTVKNKDKNIKYGIKVNKVEEQILPDIDDHLAKTINETVKSLAELKKIIKDDIQKSLDNDHKEAIRKEIIDYFVKNTKIEAPESMVSLYLDQIKDDLEKRNQPFEEDKFKENYQSHAEWNIKWYLIKDEIIGKELIDVSDDEINSKINDIISDNKENASQIKTFYKESKNRNQLYSELRNDKLFDKLSEFIKLKVVEESTKDLRKKQAAQ